VFDVESVGLHGESLTGGIHMSTSGSSNWPTNGAPSRLENHDVDPTGYPPQNRPPDCSSGQPPSFPQEGVGTDDRAFRWALYYADRQSALAYWWGLGAGLALGVLIGSFAAGTALVAALFHGK
jgi:hypothetical protein